MSVFVELRRALGEKFGRRAWVDNEEKCVNTPFGAL